MEGKELVQFVGKVKDLEAAIFANQQTLNQFDERAAALAPKCPEKPKLHNLSEPRKPILEDTKRHIANAVFFGMLGVAGVAAFIHLFSGRADVIQVVVFGFGGGMIACPLGFAYMSTELGKVFANKEEIEQYEQTLSAYKRNIERFEQENQNAQEKYKIDVKTYGENIQLFENDRQESLALLKQTETTLESALQTMYETGVIYPKYQNFVAVSALYEYLSSGRCSTLEGANGAYNLYEMELRQNIVIGQLSSIIANLEGIRTNQYTLYQEISMANHESGELLQDITDTAKIQEHYAKATAEAADVIRFATMVSAMK